MANSIIDYFKEKATEHGFEIVFNRNKSKYQVAEILNDISENNVRKMVDYYYSITTEPSLTEFCFEYDQIHKDMVVDELDEINRRNLMEETRKRVQEFREQYGGNA